MLIVALPEGGIVFAGILSALALQMLFVFVSLAISFRIKQVEAATERDFSDPE